MLNLSYKKNKLSFFNEDCHIWHIDINSNSYKDSLKHIGLLSNKEKERLYSYKFSNDQARFLISHVAIRKIINFYTGIPSSLIKFKYNEYDKPYL